MSAAQPVRAVAVVGGALAVLSVLGGATVSPGVEARGAQAGSQMPIFTWDPTWPQMPLPMQWTLGNVTGVTVDPDDHVWILQRPFSIAHGSEDGLEHDPPTASCCRMAPPVIEFDQAGNVGRSWGGPGAGYSWPEHAVEDMHERHDAIRDWSGEHGVHADDSGHLWISNNAPKGSDAHVLKFDRDGRHVLTVGTVGKSEGSHDTTALGKPAGIAVNPRTNEVFIADGYANRRVIVFDANSGAYKRHWGAYGRPPDDTVTEPGCVPDAPPPSQFRIPHAIRISADDRVYVGDRGNCRVQVFRTDGTYLDEVLVGLVPNGSVFDVEFSADAEQRFLYVLDGRNKKVWILRRADLEVLGSFGCGGHFGGCFYVPHTMAVDSAGNLYVGDVQEGKRVQRFRFEGLGPAEGR